MKKQLLNLFAILCTSGVFAQYPTTGLVAYYPFDGNTNDVSGNAYHLNGSSYDFDTDPDNNAGRAVLIYQGGGLSNTNQALTPAGSYTIAYWVKLSEVNTLYPTVVYINEDIFCRYTNTGYHQLGQYNNVSDNFSVNILADATAWKHFAMVFDDAANTVTTYVNGTLNGTLTGITYNTVVNFSNGLNVGRGTSSGSSNPNLNMYGDIDDLFIYHTALTGSEVLTLMDPESCIAQVTQQPESDTVCEGATVSLTSALDNSSGVTYQWYKGFSSLPLADGGTISGAGTNTLTISSFSAADEDFYTLKVSSLCGVVLADAATLVNGTISASPGTIYGNSPVCEGIQQGYAISAIPVATSYTWTLPNGWTGTSDTAVIYITPQYPDGTISVVATNGCGSSPASDLTIVVNASPVPVIVLNGANLKVSAGNTQYNWYLEGNAISGAHSNVYAPVADGNYTVSYVDANGCYGISDPYFHSTVGINEVVGSHFFVFPNPTHNTLTIETTEPGNFVLSNIVGEAIYAQQVQNKAVISLELIAPGVYMLTEVNTGKTVKVIKE